MTQNIYIPSTRSQSSSEENRTRNRSKNCTCERVLDNRKLNEATFLIHERRPETIRAALGFKHELLARLLTAKLCTHDVHRLDSELHILLEQELQSFGLKVMPRWRPLTSNSSEGRKQLLYNFSQLIPVFSNGPYRQPSY